MQPNTKSQSAVTSGFYSWQLALSRAALLDMDLMILLALVSSLLELDTQAVTEHISEISRYELWLDLMALGKALYLGN